MNEEPQAKGWWQTVPGILTATAGIITAVAGLIVALHQAGLFDGERQQDPQLQNDVINPPKGTESPVEPPIGSPISSSTGQVAPYPVLLPAGTEVRVGDFVYEVLAAQLDRYGPDKLSLRFKVRMTNHGSYPANFWAASFRLLVEGVLRAPENDLNELVEGHSAKEGAVEFVVPDTSIEVGLQAGEVGEGAPTIPVTLRTAKP